MVHVQNYEKLAVTNAAFESTQIDLNAMSCDTKNRCVSNAEPTAGEAKKTVNASLKGSRLWEHCFERSRELASVVRKMHCWALEGS